MHSVKRYIQQRIIIIRSYIEIFKKHIIIVHLLCLVVIGVYIQEECVTTREIFCVDFILY